MHLTLSMMAFWSLLESFGQVEPEKESNRQKEIERKEATERLYRYVCSREIAIEKERELKNMSGTQWGFERTTSRSQEVCSTSLLQQLSSKYCLIQLCLINTAKMAFLCSKFSDEINGLVSWWSLPCCCLITSSISRQC